jgi:CRISPR-associated exonuclease Cas4
MQKLPGRLNPIKAGRSSDSYNKDLVLSGLIPVHWLHTHAYCEYQLFLEKAIGVDTPPTPEMLSGSSQHELLDVEHKKKADIELTTVEAVEKARTEGVFLVARDLFVKGTALFGRIDEIVFEPDRIVIIDDKPGPRPYFSNKIQVWGYCTAFRQMYHPDLPLYGALREEGTGKFVWLEWFREDQAGLVDAMVRRIQSVLNGSEEPQTNASVRRCRPCRFKNRCPVSTD